jgi:hypothetical protein
MTHEVQSEAQHLNGVGLFSCEDLLGLRENHTQHLKDEPADH